MKAIGIDIGGTFIKFAAADERGNIIKKTAIRTDSALSKERFLGAIAAVVNAWKKEFKTKDFVLGVGLPGDTDHIKGILRWAPNIPWRNLKVAQYLRQKTGCRCFVSNDATMAAWGAHAKEFKSKYKDLIIVTMGTGIGGGIIADGCLYHGADGCAGELGHVKIDYSPKAPLCGCGARGCLEAFCGAKGIRRQAKEAALKYPRSILAKMIKEQQFSVKLLSDAAACGDKAAKEVWHGVGHYLGRGIAAMVLFFNPQAVVLAGGVSRGAKYFMPGVKEVMAAQKVKTPFKNLKILISKESDIGALGAALYAQVKADEK